MATDDTNKTLLQDVFDGELKDELESLYSSTVWSSLDEDLVDRMVELLTNCLIANEMKV